MKDSELISVIVPVYNVEKYIVQCLDSVIGQTYQNLEIILVDDGSTDESGKICDLYAQKDSRIKVIHKTNGGLSDARNVGLRIASGEYISFVDSDDWIEKDMIERLHTLCEDNNLDLVAARFCESIDGKDKDTSFTNDFFISDGIELLRINIFGDEKYVVTNSVWDRLYKRELLDGIWFPEGKKYEDIIFSTQVFLRAKRCGYLDSLVYHYTIRDDSIMGQGVKRKNGVSEDVFTDLLPQLKERTELIDRNGLIELANYSKFFYLNESLQRIVQIYTKKMYSRQKEQLISEYESERKWIKEYIASDRMLPNVTSMRIANFSMDLFVILKRLKRIIRR